jgi:hypothetical protein
MFPFSDIRSFVRAQWISLSVALATVFLPLLAAFVFLLLLTRFPPSIPGSIYLTNNVLLLFILVGYAIVFFGLVLYFITILKLAHEYRGANQEVSRASFDAMVSALAAALIAIIIVFIFVSYIAGTFLGAANMQFRLIVEANKFITLICFLLFTAIDLLIVKSMSLELKEFRASKVSDVAQYPNKRRLKSENIISFSLSSTLLINLPIIAMTILVWWLIHFVTTHPASFEAIHDSIFNINVPVPTRRIDWYLFLDGIETGMIAASVMVSQIIFLILKIRFQYREYTIDKILER